MKKITIILALIASITLSACSTVHGAGTDLQKASDWTKEKPPK